MSLILRSSLSFRTKSCLSRKLISTSSITNRPAAFNAPGTSSKPSAGFLSLPLNGESKNDFPIFGHNSRLENVRFTAEYLQRFSSLCLSPAVAPQLSIILPEFDVTQKEYEVPAQDRQKTVIFDINPNQAIRDPDTESSKKIIDENVQKEKMECHRMLVIRKKKMKVHRRKRLWKRMWSLWRKRFAQRFKKRELEFRAILTAKVNDANKFEPALFVKDYLEDLHHELIPKTYKGGRKPQWLVKELLEADIRQEERNNNKQKDLVTKENLVKEEETVDDFVKRYKK